MSYQVIARKWRPQRFNEVVGQEHITATLKYAVRSGRAAQVYLFTGIRGTGKTTLARILVKALTCLNPGEDGEPCNLCESCREITAGKSPDVVEIDGASNNSVDDVRNIKENIAYNPIKSKKKAYIIDEVHMLSKSAFNALLKTLEEPPAHTVFILATTDPQKIPSTVLSRCQRYDLKRMGLTDVVNQLGKILSAEDIPFDKDALYLVAREGEGSMRDAQTLLEQILAFGERRVTCDVVSQILGASDRSQIRSLISAIVEHDADKAVEEVRSMYDSGKAIEKAARDILYTLHQLVLVSSLKSDRFIDAPAEEKVWLTKTAELLSAPDWQRFFTFWNGEYEKISRSDYALMLFEVAVVLAASFPAMSDIRDLIDLVKGGSLPEPTENKVKKPAKTLSFVPKAEPEVKTELAIPSEKEDTATPLVEKPASSVWQTASLDEAGWRRFLDEYREKDQSIAPILRVCATTFTDDTLSLSVSSIKEAVLEGKKEEIQQEFERFFGSGSRLVFTSERGENDSVAEKEESEKKERDETIKEEIKKDPAVRAFEQMGFDLKKITVS